jgi:hypothetical protein
MSRHPHREAIDQDFLHWRSPEILARVYGIPDHSAIYRHVHATGLYASAAATCSIRSNSSSGTPQARNPRRFTLTLRRMAKFVAILRATFSDAQPSLDWNSWSHRNEESVFDRAGRVFRQRRLCARGAGPTVCADPEDRAGCEDSTACASH